MKKFIFCALLCSALWQNVAHAQNKTQQIGGFTVSAAKTIIRPDGLRLEGTPARLQSPQIDFSAPVVAFDYKSSQITQVRAINGVSFRLDLAGADPIKIEAKSSTATFDALPVNGRRTLRLSGNVDGFYQTKGARNTLSGETATISFGEGSARDVLVQVAGGKSGVQLQIASALFGADSSLGDVTLRADNADIDEKSGTASFKGNASMVSVSQANGNPQNFNVKADAFVASFATANGRQVLQNVRTQGRATIVIDAPDATQNSPTHIEVMADNALVEPNAQKLTLEGNVSGFYHVPAADATANAKPLRYDFSNADSAIARFVPESEKTAETPAGLNLQVLGKPTVLELPGFDLGLK